MLVEFIAPPGRADETKGRGYLPGLGDLMNASMQVHHTKLWFAGHADNWAFAAYELKEIKESLEDIENFSPEWQDVPVGEMVKSLDSRPSHQVENPVKFDTAHHQLTEGCNTCHAGSNRSEIKIIEPIPQGRRHVRGSGLHDRRMTVIGCEVSRATRVRRGMPDG